MSRPVQRPSFDVSPISEMRRAARVDGETVSESPGLDPLDRGELGANMIISLALVGGFLAIVPFFLDATSVNFSHRVAQTGADSAAHAAAVEYARRAGSVALDQVVGVPPLSGTFTVTCTEDPYGVQSAQAYLDKVWRPTAYGFGGGYRGLGPASAYADMHGAKVTSYRQGVEPWHGGGQEIVGGVAVFPIRIRVTVDRPTDLMFGGLYGSNLFQSAGSAAEVYPRQVLASGVPVVDPSSCPLAASWLGTDEGDRTRSALDLPQVYDWTFTLEWNVRLLGVTQ